jgi:hypothetical protein
MVKILAAVLTDGLPAVEAACVQTLAKVVHSAGVVINILGVSAIPGQRRQSIRPTRCGFAYTGHRLRPLRSTYERLFGTMGSCRPRQPSETTHAR